MKKPHGEFDIKDLERSSRGYQSDWALFDNTLYGLCQENPAHSDRGAVNAKLWLIGRGMATGIERHVKASGGMGSSLDKVAGFLHTNHHAVDSLVQRVRQLKEPLDLEKLAEVVSAHGRFCQLVSQLAQRDQVLVSFASKYLHFHAPLVPIYDRYAYAAAWRRRRKQGLEVFPKPEGANLDYYWYCLCFWQVYTSLRALAGAVTVRMAEYHLIDINSPPPRLRVQTEPES